MSYLVNTIYYIIISNFEEIYWRVKNAKMVPKSLKNRKNGNFWFSRFFPAGLEEWMWEHSVKIQCFAFNVARNWWKNNMFQASWIWFDKDICVCNFFLQCFNVLIVEWVPVEDSSHFFAYVQDMYQHTLLNK